tara:strand:+ start:53049 stop:53264 length:216 start_codon:yes stop_codon:yes gene_type:complete
MAVLDGVKSFAPGDIISRRGAENAERKEKRKFSAFSARLKIMVSQGKIVTLNWFPGLFRLAHRHIQRRNGC